MSEVELGVAIVGAGYWGPNLVRNFGATRGWRITHVVDRDVARLEALRGRFPGPRYVTSMDEVLADPDVAAVVIATPVETHFPLASAALAAGKHVLIEKPMCASVDEAERLRAAAERAGRVLAVDHTFLYTGAVEKLRALFLEGAFGEIFYLDSVRINLGLFQQTASVIDDLGPHDVSIVNHLLGEAPLEVAAVGASHVKGDHSEVAFVTLRYPSGALAHLHLSWLSPLKVRRLMISGARRMAVWDDVEPSEKVRIYDKGVEFNPDPASNALRMVSYRTGDMIAPAIDGREALSKLAEDFYAAIVHGKRPRADATDGLTVVRVLDAANRSLKRGGAFEPLTSSLPVR